MKFKTTLVLLAVGLALLAVVHYFDSRGAKAKAAEEKTGLLIDLPAADILKASLFKDGQTLAFEREAGGTWRLTAPLEAAADETEVNGLIDTLAKLRIERVVEQEAKDLRAYEIPKTEISLGVKGRPDPVRLLVGMENPLDQSLFAKRADDPRLVLLPSSLKSALDKKVFDFRQKDVFKFATAEVKGLRVRAKDVAWQAARDDDGWSFRSPVAARAAQSKLDALLEALSGLRAKAFVAESKTAESLRSFGLDKPEYEAVLSLAASNGEIVFTFHKDGENAYATTSQSAKVVAFEGTLLADLDRKVDELRDRKAADFYSWDADRVALKRGGVEIAAVKEKAGDADRWLLEGPAKEEADRSRIEGFLRKIEALEAVSFVDAPGPLASYGLEPGAEVRVRTKDYQGKEKETVLYVGAEDAANKDVAVRSPGLGYLLRVDAAFLQDWPKEAKDWKAAAAEAKATEGQADKK